MANTGCTGDHPKHLFGDDVARNHSLSSEEESCRLNGETLCLLKNFCAISDKAEQCLNSALYPLDFVRLLDQELGIVARMSYFIF